MMGRILPLRRVQGVVTEMSDEALLAACALSDTAALGALYDRFHRPVFQFLMRYFGPGHPDIDDLVQSTFLEVQRSAGGFQGRSSVRAWILGIAANLARHHVRGESRRKVMLSNVATAPPRPSRGPDDHTEQRQLLDRLHQAITELPVELRGPLVLCDMEELPGAEAARVLGLREGTLWRRIHDARKRLREILEDRERRAS
jgi:RNA polymerase sigma-70 factor (ECF subfamily)